MEILCTVGSQSSTGVQKPEKVYSVCCTLLLFPLKFAQWIFSVCTPHCSRNLPLCVHTHVCIIRWKTRLVLLKMCFILQGCCMYFMSILHPALEGWDAFPGSSASLLIVTQLTAEQDLRQEIFDLLTLENMHEEDWGLEAYGEDCDPQGWGFFWSVSVQASVVSYFWPLQEAWLIYGAKRVHLFSSSGVCLWNLFSGNWSKCYLQDKI